MRLYRQVSSDSFSILSNKPSGAFGVDTITIYGFDFAMYLSLTSLASCCCPGGKKSASSSSIKDTLGKPLHLNGAMEMLLSLRDLVL
jgi:hypothetical protein